MKRRNFLQLLAASVAGLGGCRVNPGPTRPQITEIPDLGCKPEYNDYDCGVVEVRQGCSPEAYRLEHTKILPGETPVDAIERCLALMDDAGVPIKGRWVQSPADKYAIFFYLCDHTGCPVQVGDTISLPNPYNPVSGVTFDSWTMVAKHGTEEHGGTMIAQKNKDPAFEGIWSDKLIMKTFRRSLEEVS